VLRYDIKMEVGDVQQTVEVTEAAGAIALQKDSAEISTQLAPEIIRGLPSLTRKTYEMIDLSPAVKFPNGLSNRGFNLSVYQPFVSIAGTPGTRGHNYYLDGSNMIYTRIQGDDGYMPSLNPSPESVQEVRVIANNYGAEFGGGHGAALIVTTKSGGNRFNGQVYEYIQNRSFDSRNFFARERSPNNYNNYGGAVGGPIIRNKTFFFVHLERERQKVGAPQILTVPTPLQRTGNFSQTFNTAGQQVLIYDPATTIVPPSGNPTRSPFPGNIIPTNRLDPVALNVLKFFPEPNRPGAITGGDNFIGDALNTDLRRRYQSYRIDHQISDRHKLFLRGFDDYTVPGSQGPLANTVGRVADPVRRHYYVDSPAVQVAHTGLIRPTWISEFRFFANWVNFRNQALGDLPEVWGQNWAGRLGLRNLGPDTFPSFAIAGYAELGALGFAQDYTGKYLIYGPSETMILIRGKHNIRIGGEWKKSQSINVFRQFPSGRSTYDARATALPAVAGTGNGLASFLLGRVASANNRDQVPRDSRSWYLGTFIQDDWRIRPNLTLNLGLRYEYDTPRKDVTESTNFFNATAINPVCNCPGLLEFSRDIFARTQSHVAMHGDNKFQFSPRLGFAWNVRPKWVVRGGYGWFLPGIDLGNTVWTGPVAGASIVDHAVVDDALGLNPPFILGQGFPVPPPLRFDSSFGSVPIGAAPIFAPEFYWQKRPIYYSQQMNLGIQKQIASSMVISVSYMGNLSRHIPHNQLNYNEVPPNLRGPGNAQIRRPFPQFGNIIGFGNPYRTSNFHAGVIQFTRNLSNGLSFTTHYTWSKHLDAGSYLQSIYDTANSYGPSAFDQRHRFIWGGSYELPFGPGKKMLNSRTIGNIVGGWTITGRFEARSGDRLHFGNAANTCNCFSAGTQGVNLTRRPTRNNSGFDPNRMTWFDTSVVVAPAPYTFGTANGQVYGPGFWNVDGSIVKGISITERYTLHLRGEFFNAFNHPNFLGPGMTFGTPSFGRVSSTVVPAGNRFIQLGLKFTF